MIDLQVAFPVEAIALTSVSFLASAALPTLDIYGQDFRAVDEVLINDVSSPAVVVLGKNRLIAQIPEAFRGQTTFRSVDVVSNRLTITDRSLVKFKIGAQPSKVRGILRLMQLFLKLLFTTPGSDIFAPQSGGGALRGLGANLTVAGGQGLINDFVIAVRRTAEQILLIQSRDSALPLDERLLSARVASARFEASEAALVVSVQLTSQAGRSATANLLM